MNNRITVTLLIILLLSVPCTLLRPELIRPLKNHKNSFAIVIDKVTLEKCSTAVVQYRNTVEDQGLSVYILSGSWANPAELREEIIKLYSDDKKLEGIVLVGDIPIAMIRDAQHFCSAFKMDQKKFPIFQSSVPSDRIYDDFDLKLQFISQDSLHKHCYYYSLLPESPQRIKKEIYSARIKAPVNDESKYQMISSFLTRAAEKKKHLNRLDNAVVFTGHGYLSQSRDAWADETLYLREEFPQLFVPGGNFRKLNYDYNRDIKYVLGEEIQNKDLDLLIVHGHGDPEVQYLTDYSLPESMEENVEAIKLALRGRIVRAKDKKAAIEKIKAGYDKTFGFPEDWYKTALSDSVRRLDSLSRYGFNIYSGDVKSMSPQADVILFDGCYNGSFHKENYIAGRYVLGNGDVMAGFANSVNSLQDQWIDQFAGLFNFGIRTGNLHKFNNQLENHLIGDPTFAYENTGGPDINTLLDNSSGNLKLWKSKLSDKNPSIRALAVYMTAGILKDKFSSELESIYMKDESFNVRFVSLLCLAELNNQTFHKVLLTSVKDPSEFIRRLSSKWMGKIGSEEFIQPLVERVICDQSPRTVYNSFNSLQMINIPKAKKTAEEYFGRLRDCRGRENRKEEILAQLNQYENFVLNDAVPKVKNSSSADSEGRLMAVRSFRNNNSHGNIQDLLKVASDSKEPQDLRITAMEALGWFNMSKDKNIIIKGCDEILAQADLPAKLHSEIIKTKNRLAGGPNCLVTP